MFIIISITTKTQADILNHLTQHGLSTYQELIEKLEIPRTTIVENCFRLLRKGAIIKIHKKHNNNKGRPKTYWKLK